MTEKTTDNSESLSNFKSHKDGPLVLNGITAVMTPMGDIKLTIHADDLFRSLATYTTNLRNGTILAVAGKRLLPSLKGHTHNKPIVIQATCK